ncbi:MAG TPA: ATP-binding protein [Luteibaculaceae bacterium]|nr:ATP-binding protein [Luteibaculaceae bacterium]
MNTTSPRNIALYCSLTVGCICLLFFALADVFTQQEVPWLLASAFCLLSFAASYFLFLFFIKQYIDAKVRLIYKTIHNLKTQRGKDVQFNMSEDVLKKVNRDVMDWADTQKREINKLREQESFRREFIGNLSHELKTPIFAIQGYLLTLLEGGLEDPKISHKFIDRASKSVDRMVNLIEDLDSIAQMESGQLKLDQVRFNIVDLAKDTLETFEIKAKERNIKLSFNQKYDKPIFVIGDVLRIGQVLSNLVVNSINYGKDEGSTEIRFFDMDEVILIEVADNGVGISRENIPRIFERFYRADKSRSRVVGGSGLGLSICKHIIEAHEQALNVRSTPELGSTFSFTLKKAK